MSDTQILTAETLWQLGRVGTPVASADGRVVVVPVTTADVAANATTTRLYRIDGAEPVPLTGPGASATHPSLSPDGRHLAFTRKVDDVGQIHVMATDGGEPEAVTEVPVGAGWPKWLPDGSGVVFLSYVYRDALDHEAAAARRQEIADDEIDVKVTEERLFRFWDRWITDGRIPHPMRLDLDSLALVDLTPESESHWVWESVADLGKEFDVAPDGTEVVYSAMRGTEASGRPLWGIFTVPIAGGEPSLVSGDHPADCQTPRYSPDGQAIVWGAQQRTDFYADRIRLTRYDRTDGTITVLTEDWDRSPTTWEFIEDDRLVFTAEDDARIKLFSYRLGGDDPRPLVEQDSVTGFCVAGDHVYLGLDSLRAPADVYRHGPEGIERVTAFNEDTLAGVSIGEVEDIRFAGAGGTEIQMFVCYPPGFDPNRQWPMVHMIHGGPHGVFGDQWHYRWNAQVIAARGYVVPLVNFHGSTSWGQDFAASIQGAWGDKPYKDVMAATDALVAKGFIDPEQMAVTGGSYGGYLTSWIIANTDRFACAIAHAAVTNLAGMYASDWVFHRATAYGAEYWDDRDRVDRWSPAANAAGYTTPTLVIHGERDFRVPLTQGLELYGVLKAKSVEARLVFYPKENHWILKPKASLHWYGEFLGWLDRHLSGGDA